MNFENTVRFVLKGTKEQNLKGLQMKYKYRSDIPWLLFKPGDKVTEASHRAHMILDDNKLTEKEKVQTILGSVKVVPKSTEGYQLHFPKFEGISTDGVRRIITATALVCPNEKHALADAVVQYTQKDNCAPSFYHGAVLGLLEAASVIPYGRKAEVPLGDGWNDWETLSITERQILLLCVLKLSWREEIGDLPSVVRGELSNLIDEYLSSSTGKHERGLRIQAVLYFLSQTVGKYHNSDDSFPSQLAEALVHQSLFKLFGLLSLERQFKFMKDTFVSDIDLSELTSV